MDPVKITPTPQSYWGEGMGGEPQTGTDQYGRKYVMVGETDASPGSWQLAGPYSGMNGEGMAEIGSLVPLSDMNAGKTPPPASNVALSSLAPEGFYTGNLDPNVLNSQVPGDAKFFDTLQSSGVKLDPYALGRHSGTKDTVSEWYSSLPGDFLPGNRFESSSIWGPDKEVRDAILKIGDQLGLNYEQIVKATTAASPMSSGQQGYTEASSPLDIIQNSANQMFQMAGKPPQQLFTPEQLQQSRQQGQARQDAMKKADDGPWYKDVLNFLKVPAIFGGLIAGAGAISGLINGAAAGTTAAASGWAGIDPVAGVEGYASQMSLAAYDSALNAGLSQTAALTAADKAVELASASGAAGMSAEELVNQAVSSAGPSLFDTAKKIFNTASSIKDQLSGGGTPTPAPVSQGSNDVTPDQNTGNDVLKKAFSFFGGDVPYNPSGSPLRTLSGSPVYSGKGRGLISSQMADEFRQRMMQG